VPETSTTETPPEIVAVVQQAVVACRSSRHDPTCVKAQALCARIKNTSAADLEGLNEICDAAATPKWVWWLLGGVAVAGGVGGVMLYRRRRRTG